jgi:SAM-dependent methyltransferase
VPRRNRRVVERRRGLRPRASGPLALDGCVLFRGSCDQVAQATQVYVELDRFFSNWERKAPGSSSLRANNCARRKAKGLAALYSLGSVASSKEGGQAYAAVSRNREFFAEERWSRQIAEIDTYKLIGEVIDTEIAGTRRLLDVGNGGVFEYRPELVESIVAVDLFLSQIPGDRFPDNVIARDGDALSLDEPDEAYDAVLQSYLYHHLVGADASELVTNVSRAISEAERVLRPGGKLIVAEGCVPRWFFRFEERAFPSLVALSRTRFLGGHPATMLLPFEDVVSLVGSRLNVERAERLPVGRWISHFGRRWPNALTPVRQYIIVSTKP